MASLFGSVPLLSKNPILGLGKDCDDDPFVDKINLTIGAYRTSDGKPCVLECVKQAEQYISSNAPNHEYLNQDGIAQFVAAAQVLMFGATSQVLENKTIYSIQSVAGTGGLRLAMDFLRTNFPEKRLYVPDKTWPNHLVLLKAAGFEQHTYKYLDSSGCGLDFQGLLASLNDCPEGSIILLHCCAHNPTGVDPTEDQWREVLEVVRARQLLPLFDNAYQGFVTGDPEVDAFPVRLFADADIKFVTVCSFSKNFGLYGDRLGCVHVLTGSEEEVARVGSQMRALARALYSTCPSNGARIVSTILNDPQRNAAWRTECAEMATRLNQVRLSLRSALLERHVKDPALAAAKEGSTLDANQPWQHIVRQRGMFSYTGIPGSVVTRLKDEYHIYMLQDGRVSLAGLNPQNIPRFADALLALLGTQ